MCGFAGMMMFDAALKADPELVRKMTDIISYRGPDEEGYFSSGQCAFGHRRLMILDLETGQQPVFNEDGSIAIVYSGEIYNFMELRQHLEAAGHSFKTRSDTEVIIHAYEEWGEDCVKRLRGIFAFAIWDANRKRLILARDRVGVKPLYYYTDGRRIAFGSEVKCILEIPDVPRDLDQQAIHCYFSLLYVPGPYSGVKNINKLLPAHLLVVEGGKCRLKRYWQLETEDTGTRDIREVRSRLREEIFRAVKEELVSDVPLGVFLSGGIDSSSVTAAASGAAAERIKAYTVGFEEEFWDESAKASEVAKILNAHHKVLHSDPHDMADLMRRLIWYMDEPHANYTMVVNYLVCQAARKEITVALSGCGGDEIFGGYRQFQADKISSYYSNIVPYGLRRAVFSTLQKMLAYNDQEASIQRRLARATAVDSPDPVQRHLRWVYFGAWHEEVTDLGLFRPDALKEIRGGGPDPFDLLTERANDYKGKDGLNRFFYLDMSSYMLDDLITLTDRMAMANSLEVRVPLLDHELLEFVFSIPSRYKIPGLKRKRLLKEFLLEFLPERIVEMPKQGFGMPMLLWIKGGLRDMIGDIISGSGLKEDPLIRQDVVERAFREHLEGSRDHTSRIWSAVAYIMWKETFRIS